MEDVRFCLSRHSSLGHIAEWPWHYTPLPTTLSHSATDCRHEYRGHRYSTSLTNALVSPLPSPLGSPTHSWRSSSEDDPSLRRPCAEDAAGKHVHDVVVTFLVFYSQFKCNAIADAVELSSLRLLMLINNGVAVVVNYTMTCQFPQPEWHVVYNASAASIRITVATFSSTQSSLKVAGMVSMTLLQCHFLYCSLRLENLILPRRQQHHRHETASWD